MGFFALAWAGLLGICVLGWLLWEAFKRFPRLVAHTRFAWLADPKGVIGVLSWLSFTTLLVDSRGDGLFEPRRFDAWLGLLHAGAIVVAIIPAIAGLLVKRFWPGTAEKSDVEDIARFAAQMML